MITWCDYYYFFLYFCTFRFLFFKYPIAFSPFFSLYQFLCLCILFFSFLFFAQVIHQERVEIQVCPLTGAGKRVIFGSAARCTSAVLRATCSSAPPRGCAYPMAPGLELSLPANVSRLHLECMICKLLCFTCFTISSQFLKLEHEHSSLIR